MTTRGESRAIGHRPSERPGPLLRASWRRAPLVLVMGIGYDSSLWTTLAQVPALSTQFQVILVDNRDAGRSSNALQPYAIVDMADDLAGLLDAPQDSADSPTGVVDGMDDRPGVRSTPWAPAGSAGAHRHRSRARPQRGRSDRDLELGQVERPDRRRVRWATVRVALLHGVPPEPPGGARHR